MKSPPEPESTRALAGMSFFLTRSETDRMSRESEEEDPVKVIDETGIESGQGGVGGSSVICGSVAAGTSKSAPGRS